MVDLGDMVTVKFTGRIKSVHLDEGGNRVVDIDYAIKDDDGRLLRLESAYNVLEDDVELLLTPGMLEGRR